MAKPNSPVIVPEYRLYMNPILDALRSLGGSASNEELYERVIADMKLSDELLGVMHDPERGGTTEVAYRISWARTYLKKAGLLVNSRRGVWSLTPEGGKAKNVDPKALARTVQSRYRPASPQTPEPEDEPPDEAAGSDEPDATAWKAQLLDVLRKMPAASFERLCQRMLRESGFVEVKVTGRTGDGGIDGVGLLRIQDVLSFHIIFQCKRWNGKAPISSREIRDFRGAMVGRTDKGMFFTTATFSPDAQREATRDGAPAIDLIDGDQLAELLKKLALGVRTEMVESVTVDAEFFATI